MSFVTNKPYNPRNVVVSWFGVILSEGFADDAGISISENSPLMATRAGLSGNHAVNMSPDGSFTVGVTLFPESDAARVLKSAYTALKLSGKFVAGALTIKDDEDGGGNILFVANQATLMSMSEQSYGADTGTVTFEFFVPNGADIISKLEDGLQSNAKSIRDAVLVTAAGAAL